MATGTDDRSAQTGERAVGSLSLRARPATTESLHIRGAWSADRISIAFIVAVLPPLAGVLFDQGTAVVPALAAALVVTFSWQMLFAWWRGSLIGWDGVVTAISFVVMLPAAVPLWQIVLGLTFGVVVGEQIFGGRGRAFLSPSAAGLAFLFFSFPASAAGAPSGLIGLATLPGGILLVLLGLVSWRTIAAAFTGFAVAALFARVADPLTVLALGSFTFGLVFLGCDPVSAAATNIGRLICGFLIGTLTVIFGAVEAPAVVFAVLLGAIFAPLIDHTVVWLYSRRRRRRHG